MTLRIANTLIPRPIAVLYSESEFIGVSHLNDSVRVNYDVFYVKGVLNDVCNYVINFVSLQ